MIPPVFVGLCSHSQPFGAFHLHKRLFPESLLLGRCLPAMLWQTYLTANSAVVDNSSLFLHYFDILLPSKCRNDSKTKLSAKYRQETCHIQSHGIAYCRWGHSTKQLRNKNIFPQSTLRQWFKQCNHPLWLLKCIFCRVTKTEFG